VTISVTIDSIDLDDASNRGLAAIRTAIHAAGGNTPGWDDNYLKETGRQAEFVNA
jgi:hypothetical protein